MSKTIREMREKRAQLVTDAQAILAKPELSAEDNTKFDALMDEADGIRAQIDRMERAEKEAASIAAKVDERAQCAGVGVDELHDKDEREGRAFLNWLRGGMGALSTEDREVMAKRHAAIDPKAAQSVGTNTGGGYTVPQGFYDVLTEALKYYGGMRDVATTIRTEMGNLLPMPTVNETTIVGSILSENNQASTQDVTFGQKTLNAYMYTSNIVLVSLQLLQDSAFDIGSYLAKALGTRLARIQNTHFTTGTGTGQPNGIVTASASGKVGTTGQTTSVIFDDLVDLIHSVDPLYRKNGQFMLADSSLKIIRKLKDSSGRPLYLPGYDGLGKPMADTILGYPVVINQDVATMAANAKSILFGDFSTYMIREVLGVQLLQLRERYADYLQVGFLAFNRCDGNLLDAGTSPVKYYQNSAT